MSEEQRYCICHGRTTNDQDYLCERGRKLIEEWTDEEPGEEPGNKK